MRRAYGGILTTSISFLREATIKLITAVNLQIGSIKCRFGKQVYLKICYRSLNDSYFAAVYTNPK